MFIASHRVEANLHADRLAHAGFRQAAIAGKRDGKIFGHAPAITGRC